MSGITDLLPCPFCGGPASHTGAAIRCNSFACNASLTPRWTKVVVGTAKGNPDVRFALAKADCTKRWNARAALDAGQPCDRTVEMAECAAFSAGYEAGEREGRADLASGQQVRTMEWLPIETAPLGSSVDSSSYFIGARQDGDRINTATCYRNEHGAYEWWGGGMSPTHWMPIKPILAALTPAPQHEADVPVGAEALFDLIGELGREVYYLLDDCETSGPIGEEIHTITPEALEKVSEILDRIDALPFEVPGVILGTGAMLQEAIKQTFLTPAPDAAQTEAVPVAWRVRPYVGCAWRLCDTIPPHMMEDWQVSPLYTHPAAPAPGIAEITSLDHPAIDAFMEAKRNTVVNRDMNGWRKSVRNGLNAALRALQGDR